MTQERATREPSSVGTMRRDSGAVTRTGRLGRPGLGWGGYAQTQQHRCDVGPPSIRSGVARCRPNVRGGQWPDPSYPSHCLAGGGFPCSPMPSVQPVLGLAGRVVMDASDASTFAASSQAVASRRSGHFVCGEPSPVPTPRGVCLRRRLGGGRACQFLAVNSSRAPQLPQRLANATCLCPHHSRRQ